MRVAALLVSGAALIAGCGRVTEQPPKGPFVMPGTYVLQSLNGERLPTQASGTDQILADTLYLTDAYTFVHVELLESGGQLVSFRSGGEIAGGMATDSLIHVSFLQSEPEYATFQMLITRQGQATMVVWPFTFRYQR